jgi:subfamily B ATP-binding cassette protein MsbA
VPLEAFLAIVMALYVSYDPVKKLGAINNELKRARPRSTASRHVFNEPVTIKDPENPVPRRARPGDIAFKDVSFAYKTEEPVLKGVRSTSRGNGLRARRTERRRQDHLRQPGPALLRRRRGKVTIDGIDIRDAARRPSPQHRDRLAGPGPLQRHGLQQPAPRPPRRHPGGGQAAAAKDAHADEFIRGFPMGYDTIVGERGARLSGGQKQRLAVARAFLRNAPILILDEATSALDSQSEQMIQDALRKLVVGKTVLIIAHRFSTIRDASLILVFDQGSIVARGDHAELYADEGLYRSLYDRQRTEAF